MLICFLVWLPIGFWSRDSKTTSTQRAPWLSHSVPALDNNSRHLHRPSHIQPSHLLHAVADQLCRKEEEAKHCLFRSSKAEREAQTDSFHCFLSSGYKEALCAFNLSPLQPRPSWRINNSANTNQSSRFLYVLFTLDPGGNEKQKHADSAVNTTVSAGSGFTAGCLTSPAHMWSSKAQIGVQCWRTDELESWEQQKLTDLEAKEAKRTRRVPCIALYCIGVMCSKPGGGTSQYLQVLFFLVRLGEWLHAENTKTSAWNLSVVTWTQKYLNNDVITEKLCLLFFYCWISWTNFSLKPKCSV